MGSLASDLRLAVRTLDDVLGRSIERRHVAASLLGLFSLLALGLAAVGLYGVLAHATRERTREFGVRLALGAGAGTVLRQVLWDRLSLAGLGIGLGVLGALAAGSALGSLLFDVSGADPVTLSGVATLLSVVAALAAALPALRASRVDPVEALRCD